MKKSVAFILTLILILSCLSGCGKYDEDTVMEVDASPVSWDELAYWMGKSQDELQQYYSLFGEELEWSAQCRLDDSLTCAEWVIEHAKSSAVQVHVLTSKAIENGVTITEENEAEIEKAIAGNIETCCGEGATESDFESFIKAGYYSLDYYKEMLRTSYYYNGMLEKLYGKNTENLTDADVLAYAQENDYIEFTYIMCSEQQANDFAAMLNEIEDNGERTEKFSQLKAEFCKDPSKTTYPDGYCFVSDEADAEIESAAIALEEYEISELVISSEGCFIVMRLPLSGNACCKDDNGLPIPLRTIASRAMLDEKIGEWIDSAKVQMVGKFKRFDFTSLFDENGYNYLNYEEFSSK